MKTENKQSPLVRQNGSPHSTVASVTVTSPTHNTSELAVASTTSLVTTNDTTNIPPLASTSLPVPYLPGPLESPGLSTSPTSSPYLSLQANDQLLRVLTEKSGHWFSLLPRNPCDLSSLTTTPPAASRVSPQASSTPAGPRSPPPSPALPLTPSAASASASPHHPAGLLNYPLSALQVRSLSGISVPDNFNCDPVYDVLHLHLPHPFVYPLFSPGEAMWFLARSVFWKLAQQHYKSQPASVQQPHAGSLTGGPHSKCLQ